MKDVPWSLHLLAELLSVFSPDTDDVAAAAVDRIAEAVDAEIVAVVREGLVHHAIGVDGDDLRAVAAVDHAGTGRLDLAVGAVHVHCSPLDERSRLVVARLTEAFDMEERALLRAMGRTLSFLQQLVDALAAERVARSMAERHAAQTTHVLGVLRERNRVQERLVRIQRSITERIGTEELLSMVVEGLRELTGAAATSLLIDDGQGDLVPIASAGVPGPLDDDADRPPHPARVAVVEDGPRWRRPCGQERGSGTWCLAVPVHRDGAPVGALTVESSEPEDPQGDEPFRRATVEAVASFADHASLALNDANARRALDEALSEALHQATHDGLTGLPNRAMVVDHLDRRLRTARLAQRQSEVTVLFVDVDRFKQVNDAQGHAAGDRFLRTLAERLRAHVREGDVVGRLAGDEFVVITSQPDPALADELAARLVRLLAEPIDLGGRPTTPSVSIGVARAGPDDNAEALLANADLAMYRAKQTGRGRHEHYDHRLRVAAQRRARAEHELRRALARDELVVHYQPVVELPGRSVVGVEALVRWQRPDGTLVQPGEFIPVAEETGLISEIDVVVLRTACSDAVPWRSSDDRGPLTVAVNLSAQRFSDPALPDVVASVLDDTGLQASRLFLEITESTMMEEHEGTTATMERLLGLGVQLAIDDFGTGYSSLRYLKRFPVGALKIDRSFVDGLGADRDDEAIVEAVTGLARSLRLGAIGEGVETEVQCRRLEELGCRLAQGYLFGRPADAATTRRLLLDGARVRDR